MKVRSQFDMSYSVCAVCAALSVDYVLIDFDVDCDDDYDDDDDDSQRIFPGVSAANNTFFFVLY